MTKPLKLHPDRLFPTDPAVRDISRRLYAEVAGLPIISPHGHTDPEWWATDASFGNATELLLHPDHYVLRMLYSQGVPLEALGIRNADADPRESWRLFAERYHLFRGTPSRMWLDWVFAESFGLDVLLSADTSDHYYDEITAKLETSAFRPRALFERYSIEVIATTENPLDDLRHHQAIRDSGWSGRVITAYRPDPVIDPEFEGFVEYGGTSVAISGGVTVSVPSGFFQPIFSTREVTTEVTVFDGATVVIGGLTREEVKTVDDKVPVLGNLPLIGAAFRSTGKTTTKRNLMVFVTANLVSPGGATLRSSHPGMRAGSTFSNPVIISPGGAVYREPIEPALAPGATNTAPAAPSGDAK